jgi:hypothetical protein
MLLGERDDIMRINKVYCEVDVEVVAQALSCGLISSFSAAEALESPKQYNLVAAAIKSKKH